jgi:hypothetical protein
MKQNINVKSLVLAAAVSLGFVASAAAQSANVAVPNPATTDAVGGLLGSRYTKAEYLYVDFTGNGPSHGDGFKLEFNQPLNANFDLLATYDWVRAKYAGVRLTGQDAEVGAVAYSRLEWGRPFVLATAGWQWQKAGGLHDDSFSYKVGVGSEFQVAPAFVVTPYVNFFRQTGFNNSEFDFGVKVAYRVTKDWSLTASAQYDAIRHDKDASEYTVGAAFHF